MKIKIYSSSSRTIHDHVKSFRPRTSFRGIHDVKHFSFFVQINVMNTKFLIVWHLVRRHRLRKYKHYWFYTPISKEEIGPGPAWDQNRHPKHRHLNLYFLTFCLACSASKTYVRTVLFRASAFSKRSTRDYRTFRALVEYSFILLNWP